MKKWHIISGTKELVCDFHSVYSATGTLYLVCADITVKVFVPNFYYSYYKAKDGRKVEAVAISKKGEKFNKSIELVFK